MRYLLFYVAFMLPMLTAWAGQQPLATISDPTGDDYGAGTLTYPQRPDFQTGDLDLLQMKISREENGFWFEAMFKNPIRDPGDIPASTGAESLANFSRKGFYQFNIDVYVDTDRVKGSGNTFTMPGRQARIDPAYAWEKTLILTPRPELMRQQLLDALAEQFPDRPQTETEAAIDQSIFFATRIRIRGKSIAFFVPASFIAGSDGTGWAVTALVTGAITSIPADLTFFPTTKAPLERLQLGAMQPAPGHPKDTFGYSGATPSPVVDMLGASVEQQKRQLAAKDNLTGLSWDLHAANSARASVVASGAPIVGQKPAGLTNATPAESLGNLFQPESPVAAKSIESMPAGEMPLADSPIAKRLRALQQLFEHKLIDEPEYKQQRQRILKDL